jgi:filamentous hemagglutinin family protein
MKWRLGNDMVISSISQLSITKAAILKTVIALLPLCTAVVVPSAVSAQVTFDNNFGNTFGTRPTDPSGVFTYLVRPGQGLQTGNDNLFHSFDQFNLRLNESIRFENPGVTNIVTRVTGGSISDIAGTISVEGNPTFYLINPSGIIFNQGAILDINGAFVASTSPGLFFNNGDVEFRALSPQAADDALLSIAQDPGSFNQIGRTGNIQINAEIGPLPNPNLDILRFDANDLIVNNSGDLDISSNTFTSGIDLPGGLILVGAENVFMLDSVWATENSLTSGVSGNNPSGGIAIFANNDVVLNETVLTAASIPGQDGNAGLVLVGGNNLVFENFTSLQTQTSGSGQAGVVALFTNDRQGSITFNQSAAFSSVEPPGISENNAVTSTFADFFDGQTGILSDIFFRGSGYLDGFSEFFYILVDTGTLVLENGSSLQTLVRGDPDNNGSTSGGSAGWIGISANNVLIDASAISSEVFVGAAAAENGAGAVALDVDNLLITNGSGLFASIDSDGTPGVVAVNASGDVVLSGNSRLSSEISMQAETRAFNQQFGGGVEITADRILLDGSEVTVANEGIGDAGDVVLTANVFGLVNNSKISAAVTFGQGGDISLISSDLLVLENSSNITVDNEGSFGIAGNILTVANIIVLDENSSITAETVSASEGGNIALGANFLILANNSNLTTNSRNIDGRGGNILLEVPGIIYATPSRDNNIRAEGRDGGDGGVITFLSAPLLSNIAEREQDFPESNDITTFGAVEGEVGFRSGVQDLNPVQEQVTLPTNLIDASRLIAQGCAAGNLTAAQEIGELVITGRGGVPPAPSEQVFDVGGGATLLEVPEPEAMVPIAERDQGIQSPATTTATAAEPTVWVEAQGWTYSEDGEVVLTAAANSATFRGMTWSVPGCDDVF